MGIEELKKEALERAENAAKLAAQVEDLKKQVGNVAKENAEKLYVPFQKSMNEVLDVLRRAAKQHPNFANKDVELPLENEDAKENSAHLYFEVDSSSVRLRYHEYKSYGGNFPVGAPQYWTKAAYYHWARISEWFRNEDSVNRVIEKASAIYTELLEKYSVLLKEESQEYETIISTLKKVLSECHSIEQQEDGTVEIRLGGKTYKAVIKED